MARAWHDMLKRIYLQALSQQWLSARGTREQAFPSGLGIPKRNVFARDMGSKMRQDVSSFVRWAQCVERSFRRVEHFCSRSCSIPTPLADLCHLRL